MENEEIKYDYDDDYEDFYDYYSDATEKFFIE